MKGSLRAALWNLLLCYVGVSESGPAVGVFVCQCSCGSYKTSQYSILRLCTFRSGADGVRPGSHTQSEDC